MTYQPQDEAELELVEKVILEKWFLLRNERRYSEMEQDLADSSFAAWTDAQHKNYQLALRYKTAAERSTARAVQQLETFMEYRIGNLETALRIETNSVRNSTKIRKEIGHAQETYKVDLSAETERLNRLEGERIAAAGFKTRAQTLFQGQLSPKKLRKIPILDQWVEVTIEDGKTVTTLYPPNGQLIKEGQAMLPPPEMVYRRINFPNGVPEEYAWTTRNDDVRKYGGLGTQRMTVDTWLEAIEEEKTRADGHIGPLRVGNLPRPKERGTCDCEFCTEAYARIETLETEPGA